MNPFKKQSLLDSVQSMIDFFDGYEYGETAIVMSHEDYLRFRPEFTMSDRTAFLGSIPVYQIGICSLGHISLTTIEKAEQMLNAII